jgi:hypothetical protein
MFMTTSPTKTGIQEALPPKKVHLKIIGSEKWVIEMGTLKDETDNSVMICDVSLHRALIVNGTTRQGIKNTMN